MSWLFGLNKGQPNQPDFSQLGLPAPPGDGGSDDKGGSKKDSQGQSMEAYRFDSAALERAAKAAKDLESSRMFYTTNSFAYGFYQTYKNLRCQKPLACALFPILVYLCSSRISVSRNG